jgi:hypothetical protein
MSERPNIPNAPPHLRNLLQRLPEATGGFVVSQHYHDPRPDEWFAGWNGGDTGPHSSSEEALFAGIQWLYRLYTEASEARDKAWDEIAALRAQLDQSDDRLDPWRKALDG